MSNRDNQRKEEPEAVAADSLVDDSEHDGHIPIEQAYRSDRNDNNYGVIAQPEFA